MKRNTSTNPLARSLRILVSTLLLAAATITPLIAFTACDPPVSNEATVTISGKALDNDGNPLANQEIKLWKSAVPIFDSEVVLGWAIGVGNAFRTVQTNADGIYTFTLKGDEVNNDTGSFAAYFAVSMNQGVDLAVASPEFNFSNQKLNHAIDDMQFWDTGTVTVEGGTMNFSWDSAPTAPSDGEYLFIVDGAWGEQTKEQRVSLSTLTLPPNASNHRFQIVAMGNRMRYRTAFKTFSESNPRGQGVDYKQPENNNISATDCEGNNLFNLNDGKYSGGSNIESFSTSPGDAARCVHIKLQTPQTLSDILVHNGLIVGMPSATTVVSVLSESGEWTIVDELNGSTGSLNLYYRHLEEMPQEAIAEVKLEVIGGNARFDQIGEVVLYPKMIE